MFVVEKKNYKKQHDEGAKLLYKVPAECTFLLAIFSQVFSGIVSVFSTISIFNARLRHLFVY
jgi:hypothetical protein